MGVVYAATDLRLGRPVAIKVIADERAGDAGFRERFEREARLAASFDHPNVIPVYAAGEEDGHLFIAMRLVAGTDLDRLLRRDGPVPFVRAARSSARSQMRSTRRMQPGSSTATSSRPTCCCPAITSTSATSG